MRGADQASECYNDSVIQRIAPLLERVDALLLRDWVLAAGVLSLIAAIAWIGRNVGRLLEGLVLLQARMHIAEANAINAEDRAARVDERVTRVEESAAKSVRNVEIRQDRLQSKVENWGKSWRDSGQLTQHGQSGELTKIDWRKPE